MFSDLIVSSTHRAAAVVGAQLQTTGQSLVGTRARNMVAVITVAARTAGTVTVTAQDANTVGGTYSALRTPAATAAIAANGVTYMEFVGPIGPFLRFDLTPGGGFDGTVAIVLHADDTIDAASGTGA